MNDSNLAHKEYLDPAVTAEIEDMMDGDKELIADLIDTMLDTAPELMNELSSGIRGKNAIQVREAAHALKAASGQLGANLFAEICKELEALAKTGDVSNAKGYLSTLPQEYDKLQSALSAWKQSL